VLRNKKNIKITDEMLRKRCPLFNKPKQSEEDYWAEYAEREAKYFAPKYPQSTISDKEIKIDISERDTLRHPDYSPFGRDIGNIMRRKKEKTMKIIASGF
jgi:hypothetical protein